jgi:hypothetical protein
LEGLDADPDPRAEGGLASLGAGLGPGDQPHHDRFREQVLKAVGRERLATLTAAGHRLALAEAADQALQGILAD